ncbi:C69 family dipeptidase, partial [bacterium]|nr:C69 family dipeptidase [bacterium]
MKNLTKLGVLFTILLTTVPTVYMCDAYMAQGEATVDGKIILGAIMDWTLEAPYPIVNMQRATHGPEDVDLAWMSIPQAPETYAYTGAWVAKGLEYAPAQNMDAPLIAHGFNEYGVSIGANSIVGYYDDTSRSAPSGIDPLDATRLVLERAQTAVEGRDIIMNIIEEYGYYSDYNLGGDDLDKGQLWLIADQSEVWVVECCGSTYSAAMKITAPTFHASNLSVIEQVETISLDYAISPSAMNLAVENGWVTNNKVVWKGNFTDPRTNSGIMTRVTKMEIWFYDNFGNIDANAFKSMMQSGDCPLFLAGTCQCPSSMITDYQFVESELKNRAWFCSTTAWLGNVYFPIYRPQVSVEIAPELLPESCVYWKEILPYRLSQNNLSEVDIQLQTMTDTMIHEIQESPSELVDILNNYHYSTVDYILEYYDTYG